MLIPLCYPLHLIHFLRPLFLTRYSYEDEDEDDVNSGLILDTIISFQATTLTHLTIFVEEGCDIPFANIIRSCPHLVDLKMSWVDTNMSTAPTCCPNMKSLSFMINHGDEFDVDDITKRFPELERFMVTPFYYAGDLRIIQSNCPKLRVIGNSSQDCDDDDDDCTPPSSDDSTTIAVGVRSFLIKDDGHWLDEDHGVVDDVMEFMKRNSHTLQDICFYGSLPIGGEQQQHLDHGSDSNALTTFNRMTSYTQQIRHQQHLRMASMVARNSPHLKSWTCTRLTP